MYSVRLLARNSGKETTISGVPLWGLGRSIKCPGDMSIPLKQIPAQRILARARVFRRLWGASTTVEIRGLESWLRDPVECVANGNFEILGGSEATLIYGSSGSDKHNVCLPRCWDNAQCRQAKTVDRLGRRAVVFLFDWVSVAGDVMIVEKHNCENLTSLGHSSWNAVRLRQRCAFESGLPGVFRYNVGIIFLRKSRKREPR